MTVDTIRAEIPALSRMLQVNAGTKGLSARPVVDALLDLTREIEMDGYAGYCRVQAKADAARDRLAGLLGCPKSALAFTRHATDSLNVALSLPWDDWTRAAGGPVDILISDHEYPTTNLLFGYLSQTRRANLVRFALKTDPTELVDELERARTPNTRFVVFSHVCCNTGIRTRPEAATRWAKENGLVSFVDGAQAVGQFPIDLAAIGADLYIGNGHKWLFGPNGVGLLFLRPGFESELTPPLVGLGTMHFDPSGVYTGEPRWMDGARRFEPTATRPAQIFAAMSPALDWIERCGGLAQIEAWQKSLTARVKSRILEMPDRFELLTPLEWDESSALASVRVKRRDGTFVDGTSIQAFCDQLLRDERAFVRSVPEFHAIRLSMAYYNNDEDFERFFEIIEELR